MPSIFVKNIMRHFRIWPPAPHYCKIERLGQKSGGTIKKNTIPGPIYRQFVLKKRTSKKRCFCTHAQGMGVHDHTLPAIGGDLSLMACLFTGKFLSGSLIFYLTEIKGRISYMR